MSTATETPTDLISPAVAGKLVGAHRKTVWYWIRKGWLRGWETPWGYARVSRAELLSLFTLIQSKEIQEDKPGRHGI